jgi:hypothetical protein
VLGNILAIPRLGVVATICSAITGQIIGSYLVDAFGRFGVSKLPFQFDAPGRYYPVVHWRNPRNTEIKASSVREFLTAVIFAV